MTGICGWFGSSPDNSDAVLEAMREPMSWGGADVHGSMSGPEFALATRGPLGTTGAYAFGPLKIAVHGHPRWKDAGARTLPLEDVARHIASVYRERGAGVLSLLGGDFALAIVDDEKRQALLAVDRTGIRNLVYRKERGVIVFAATLDALVMHPWVRHRVEPQAIYDYVYFHMIPGPRTAFEGTYRIPPGHCLVAGAEGVTVTRYWQMEFREDIRAPSAKLEAEFKAVLRNGVENVSAELACATFLSGGTDSSTVTGLLAESRESRVKTYSIGFDAAGYDEMEYARIAAAHFKAEHHEYYVTPDNVVAAIPMIAAEYDQPFGNASAVPTYYCAKLAAGDGVVRMLAGDGGDELFGGNARYARQYQLSLYQSLPLALREALLEPVLRMRASQALPLLRKGLSYVEQAKLPMPARYETYNLLERLGPGTVFDRGFLETVDRARPLTMLAAVHDGSTGVSLINRMIAIDLKFTLADNDLPKVTRMCDLAGIDAAFPLLDDAVVDFSASLAPELKLKRTQLRYFFKKALRDFLPPQVIAKKKHGFGLPAGLWLANHPSLRALSRDALANLGKRGIIDADFLDRLVGEQLHQHAAYYGTMVWILMMLELWFQHHVDVAHASHVR